MFMMRTLKRPGFSTSRLFVYSLVFALITLCTLVTLEYRAHAQNESKNGDFAIQVSPSPLVTTIRPGQQTEVELKIHNTGSTPQDLSITIQDFAFDETTGEVKLDEKNPSAAAQWVTFASKEFGIEPGRTASQKVILNPPQDIGFSYHFAIVISQKNTATNTDAGRIIKGSVAVFTLINVDRPDAINKLDLTTLEVSQRVYEYLPAEISVGFKNGGNTILQPYGNIYIQRNSTDTTPIATLPVNETKGYILPQTTRRMQAAWQTGFPFINTNSDGSKSEQWNWSNIGQFRIGKYTAKLVGVYYDGKRDIPIESEVSFWVIPWKILGIVLVIVLLILFGLWSLVRNLIRSLKRARQSRSS